VNRLEQLLDLRLTEPRHGRVRAHAAGIRAGVAVADALEVLRRGERERPRAVGDREQRHLLALQQLFDEDIPSEPCGSAERVVELLLRVADEHALAGRQPVGLHDARRSRDREAPRGRHGGRLEHVLREGLRALDARRSEGGAERRDPTVPKRVDEPDDKRSLGADDDEVDPELTAEREQAFAILGAHRVALAEGRDPRVARGGVQLVDRRAPAELPGECVLAAAGPDDQHLHGSESTGAVGSPRPGRKSHASPRSRRRDKGSPGLLPKAIVSVQGARVCDGIVTNV
jgi:hypothetical protein